MPHFRREETFSCHILSRSLLPPSPTLYRRGVNKRPTAPRSPPAINRERSRGDTRPGQSPDHSSPLLYLSLSLALFLSLEAVVLKVGHHIEGAGLIQSQPPPLPVLTNQSRMRAQFEALLLEELLVEGNAVPEFPVLATDFRIWGRRKASQANW